MTLKSLLVSFIFSAHGLCLADTFRMNLASKPNLSLYAQKATFEFVINQIHGTLLRFDKETLKDGFAKKCEYKTSRKIVCELKKDLKFSDGSPITAAHFVSRFREFINPKNKTYRAEILFDVVGAEEIYAGKKPLEELGVRRLNDLSLEINLARNNYDFIYYLASALLSPLKDDKTYSGPYSLVSQSETKIALAPNPYFYEKNPDRPNVEFLVVPEESIALNMYQQKELDLLRRLPTLYIQKFREQKDYHENPLIRFDYFGFSPDLIDQADFRKALAQSLNYEELKSILSAKGKPPGCTGLSDEILKGNLCIESNLAAAVDAWKKVPLPLKATKIHIIVSSLGGDDHKRVSEWLQSEWKKNLGLNTSVEMLESKIFVNSLKTMTNTIYRKGIGLERPTCLAALELFTQSSPDNYSKIKDSKLSGLIAQLKLEKSRGQEQKLCREAVGILVQNNYIIPTGPLYFSYLLNPAWSGVNYNEFNQDLSMLKKAH